jgi:tRNA pseudouridine38-40 synthase
VNARRVFRLTLAYDGTGFHGWQRQPGLRTVQGELEGALGRVLGVQSPSVHGAGRTDAGVHARGQVASFEAETHLPAAAVRALLGRELPEDVRVTAATEASEGFHARHSARGRRYVYRLLDSDDILLGRIAWDPGRALDEAGLARAASPLEGEHDCSAFEARGSSPTNPVCRIERAAWRRWEGGWSFEVIADHFLYHMVRNLVGTCLDAQRRVDPAAWVRDARESRSRARAGATAPAKGLCLESVYYEGEERTA